MKEHMSIFGRFFLCGCLGYGLYLLIESLRDHTAFIGIDFVAGVVFSVFLISAFHWCFAHELFDLITKKDQGSASRYLNITIAFSGPCISELLRSRFELENLVLTLGMIFVPITLLIITLFHRTYGLKASL
jgi:hypothetical protein